MLRTHTCGELRIDHVDQQATVCGWVDTYRDHGGGVQWHMVVLVRGVVLDLEPVAGLEVAVRRQVIVWHRQAGQ